MKLKNSFFYTLRESVKDEDSGSGNLLVRSGMIKKSSSGVYMYMPMGYKVLKKIESIIRDEMDKTGAQELLMPSLIPEDVYIQSGRREGFGNSMFSLKDRFAKPFVLGPTHEELFVLAAASRVRSYKDFPFNLYQFQTKFRDEPRPRFGLIRVREFIMKDAYSFDADLAGLDVAYKKMFDAYKNSFDRMGIDYKIVTADTGVMGGLLSEEFQAVTEIGEDVLVLCDTCDFASNIEVAACVTLDEASGADELPYEKVSTPNAKTIEEVSNFMGESSNQFVKTLLYKTDKEVVAVCVRGDAEVNETKVRKLLAANEINLADPEVVVAATNAKVGFAGPIGLKIRIIVDTQVSLMRNFIVGANETDVHFKNANLSDFTPSFVSDVRQIKEGDVCPTCHQGHVGFKKGIEIGNTFKLGDKYAKALGLEYLDANNQLHPVVMGSYGIGPGRCLADLVEQNHDDKGILWPKEIAPYQVAIVVINSKVDLQNDAGNLLYSQLKQHGYDVLLDDRDERAGVKFNDMDLIGIPLRITVGKTIENNQVEIKGRSDTEVKIVDVDQVYQSVKEFFQR